MINSVDSIFFFLSYVFMNKMLHLKIDMKCNELDLIGCGLEFTKQRKKQFLFRHKKY